MNFIPIISIINNFSIIYAVLGFICAFFGRFNQNNYYILVCLIAFLMVVLRNKAGKKAVVLLPILFVQMINAEYLFDYIFILFVIGFCIYYVVNERDKTTYDFLVDNFKASCGVIFAVIVLALIFFKFSTLEAYSGRYIFIYFISSIILLRAARYAKCGDNSPKIKKINLRYSIILIVLSIMFSETLVKQKALLILGAAYNMISNAFFYIFSWLFLLIGTAITEFLKVMPKPRNSKAYHGIFIIKHSSVHKKVQMLSTSLKHNDIFNYSIKISIMVLVVLFVLKHVKKKNAKVTYEDEFTESKEVIKNDNSKDKVGITEYLRELTKVKTSKDIVKHYYRKFLRLCAKKNIDIYASDTSKDVADKADVVFPSDSIINIRGIYIKAKYSDYTVQNEDASTIKQLYLDIKH